MRAKDIGFIRRLSHCGFQGEIYIVHFRFYRSDVKLGLIDRVDSMNNSCWELH